MLVFLVHPMTRFDRQQTELVMWLND